MKKKLSIWIWLLYALVFLALPFTAFLHAQTKPINNLVVQNSGTNVSGLLKANGASAATAAAAGTDYLAPVSPTITTPSIVGLVTWPSGTDQTFHPNASVSGFNPGAISGDPSGLANGDLWYDSTGNNLRARINGATISLGAGGGGGTPGGSTTQVQYNSAGVFAGSANFTFSGTALTNLNPGIGVTTTDGHVVGNGTAATSGAQQWSPRIRQYANGWHTGSGGGTTEVDGYSEIRPSSSLVFPTFIWAWATAFNNGSGTDAFWTDGSNFFAPNLVANNATAASSSGGGSMQSKGGSSAVGTVRGQAGTSGKYFPAGGAIFDHFADVGNTSTTETDLYSDSILGNTLAVTGAKLYATYALTIVSSATATRQIRIYFAGTVIYDSTALTFTSAGNFTVDVWIIEDSSTSIRYRVIPHDGNGTAVVTVVPAVGKLTGLTLTGANILKITGQAASTGAATNDIVAIMGNVAFFPAL